MSTLILVWRALGTPGFLFVGLMFLCFVLRNPVTGTCFIQKIYAPSSSLLQGKYLPFSPSPLRLNIFRLFVILSLTQLYRYTPKIFLFSTATFKYTYRAPLRRIGQEYSANVAWSTFQLYLVFHCIRFCRIINWKQYWYKLNIQKQAIFLLMITENILLNIYYLICSYSVIYILNRKW